MIPQVGANPIMCNTNLNTVKNKGYTMKNDNYILTLPQIKVSVVRLLQQQ